jgi:hypothetical protein
MRGIRGTRSTAGAMAAAVLIWFCISGLEIGIAHAAPDTPSAPTATPGELFDGQRAWRVDSTLAAPAFAGRRSGTAGGTAAEAWIASQFGAFGLRPGGPDGTFFQSFPVVGYEPKKASLEILDGPFGRLPLVDGDDFTLFLTPAAGKGTAEAVFVGYGIDAQAKGRNDYAGCDLKGKIAIIIRGKPEDGKDWETEFRRTHTFPAACGHGAVAVLYYQGRDAVAGAALMPEAYRPDIPGGYISERVTRLLLRETGWTLEEVQEKLKEGPFPLPSGKRLRFETTIKGPAQATGRNVLGMIRGTDPRLDGEIVIFGAHHDHIGIDGRGLLYPGANDNASGASVVIEAARAAAASGWQPRRTVYFVTFGGEELGLLGSRQMVATPPFALDRVVTMLNLDMAGHGDGGFGVAGGTRIGAPYFAWRAGLDSASTALLQEGQLHGEGSDYFPFEEKGVPVMTAWSRGQHRRYHDIEDRARYIKPEILGTVGRELLSLLVAIADSPDDLRDGMAAERGLRAQGTQVPFAAIDAVRLIDPDRAVLDGDHRIAGRLVQIDAGRGGSAEMLARLGGLIGTASDRKWLQVAHTFADAGEAWEGMKVTLLPVATTASLERIGPEATRALCAAGLAGATWTPGAPAPTQPICDALGKEARPMIVPSSADWRGILDRTTNLKVLLRWDRSTGALPAPPPASADSRVLLVLPVEGVGDSSIVREAFSRWGERWVHLDIGQGLEKGVPDSESLQFIAALRRSKWPAARIEAFLGGNLKRFH